MLREQVGALLLKAAWTDADELTRANCLSQAKALIQAKLPKQIYKYRAISGRSLDNLKSDTVWCSSADAFNDPYDCALSPKLWETIDDFREHRYIKNQSAAAQMGPMNLKFDYQVDLSPLVDEAVNAALTDAQKSTSMCCFSENDRSLLLWSHYAQNHSGICICYDTTKLPTDVRSQLYPVIYSNIILPTDGGHESDETRIESARLLTSLQKARDWAYEQEWRLLYFAEPNKSRVFCRPSAIFFGARVNKDDLESVLQISNHLSVPCYRMSLSGDAFELIPGPASVKITGSWSWSVGVLDIKYDVHAPSATRSQSGPSESQS